MKNERTRKILYWVATIWLCLGMTSTAIVQMTGMEDAVKAVTDLGYPHYFLILLAAWKLLGVIAVLLPGFLLLKEWAYAGFFFAMSGAIYSHIATGTFSDLFGSSLLLLLTLSSWWLRPANRKIISATP